MKKSDLFFNIAIPVLIVGIIAVVLFKFVFKDTSQLFHIKDVKAIQVSTLDGDKLPLEDFLSKDKENYCLLFELSNCYSCIFNGLEDLKKMKQAGFSCLAIAVHDSLDEVTGWSQNHDFSPFLVMKKIDFFQTIHSSTMPVIFSIKNGKVENFKFITP